MPKLGRPYRNDITIEDVSEKTYRTLLVPMDRLIDEYEQVREDNESLDIQMLSREDKELLILYSEVGSLREVAKVYRRTVAWVRTNIERIRKTVIDNKDRICGMC